jgi:hypothetical protein
MALPDPLPLAWTDKAPLNPGSCKEFGIATNLSLTLRKVEGDELIE